MNQRHSHRRLCAAVLVLSTATAGTGTLVTAPAARAAAPAPVPAPAPAPAPASEAAALPSTAEVLSSGATGCLTSRTDVRGRTFLEWRGFADGSVTPLSGGTVAYDSGSDHAVVSDGGGTLVTVRDMRPGATWAASFDLAREFAPGATLTGAVGAHLYVTVPTGDGFRELYELYLPPEAGATARKTKLTSRARGLGYRVVASSGDKALVMGVNQTTGNPGSWTYWRATATVGADAAVDGPGATELTGGGWWPERVTGAYTADHQAWTWGGPDGFELVVASAGGERRIPVGNTLGTPHLAGILGQHLAYGALWDVHMPPDERFPLHGRDLTAPDSAPYTLLEDFTSVAHAPDGSLLVRGTSTETDGLFRVSAGAGTGRPVVSLVADTGRDLSVRILKADVPSSIDLQSPGGPSRMAWTLNRAGVFFDLTLVHTATGARLRTQLPHSGASPSDPYVFEWDGLLDGASAPNGAYTWEVSIRPFDGVGTPATASGGFEVHRERNPHDFDDNGSTDLLARDAAGVLWRDDLLDQPVDGTFEAARRTKVGGGWNTYRRIEAVGNIAGAAHGDLVGVDGAGVLWHYLGKGDGTFTARRKVGGGWQVYDKITGGSDLNGDGRPDLLATDRSGVSWFYAATGSVARPFESRRKVGGGWQVHNQITAVGNIAGTAAGDLVARDTAGVLWLYQGNGRGGFAGRVRVGGGWQVYSHLVGAGDVDNDGRPDLVAHGGNGTVLYGTTGSATHPFGRLAAELYPGEGTAFDRVL
ncbi:FG-GAP repeat domain-containing protein [Streptomyces sp. NPDC056503]|uniref:FG-GAP repeat domain-containing protein n=1 Tax=Streptomyces sp. NPDC056503 TaxID=3345842 RepID=UPI00369CBAC3